jgi:hypothetical protein
MSFDADDYPYREEVIASGGLRWNVIKRVAVIF